MLHLAAPSFLHFCTIRQLPVGKGVFPLSKETDQAVAVYRDEYNCAQAIFSVYGERFGVDGELAKKIACGFGGGMGRSGGMCGVVSAALMVLGLRYGMTDSTRQEDKELTYEKVRQFIELFEELHGSTNCTDLLGCDLGTDEGFKEAREKNLTVTVCEKVVADAGELLEGLLDSKL
jgi:C_GCAxxG_C_C family probable redox protein